MINIKSARILPSAFTIGLVQEVGAWLVKLFLGKRYVIHINIKGRLKHGQRYVLAANHQSMLDPFAILALLQARHRFFLFPMKFMTIPKIYHKPYIKPFAYLLGCYPAHIKERNHHTYGVDGTIKLLSYGYNICIFPEGTRTTLAESKPKDGVCRVLKECPDAKLLLAHIQWTPGPINKRHINLVVAAAPDNLNKNDPKAIMEAIYAL